MAPKSLLKRALAQEKGVNIKALKDLKMHKQALKVKRNKLESGPKAIEDAENAEDADDKIGANESEGSQVGEDEDAEESDEDDEAESGNEFLDIEAVDDSDTSESDVEMEEKIERQAGNRNQAEHDRPRRQVSDGDDGEADGGTEEEDEEEEGNEDIPLSDLEDLNDSDKEDLIPHTRLTINNTTALLNALSRIAIPRDSSVPFAAHQTVTSSGPTADSIPDVSDDLKRELAFYSQGLEAANEARTRLRAENVPFSRPGDYFAEMVKEDAHMEKVRARLVEEAAAKKASAEAKKLRDMKKFGKQVQVAKLQERQKTKRDALDKIKQLKRKRQENSDDVGTQEADLFDVGVEDEIGKHKRRNGNGNGPDRSVGGDRVPNAKRQKKNEKYGLGGKKRHSKSGDAVSTGDLSGFNSRKMKAGARTSKAQRPGKNRRKAMSTKR